MSIIRTAPQREFRHRFLPLSCFQCDESRASRHLAFRNSSGQR